MRIFFWLKMSLWTESPKSTWASIITLYLTLNKYLSVRQEVSENDRGMSLHETQKFIWAAIKSNYCYIIYSKKRFLNLFQALYDHIHEIVYKSISKKICAIRGQMSGKKSRHMIVMTKSIRTYTGLSSLCFFMQNVLPG